MLLDVDSQGSVSTYLGLKPAKVLYNLIVHREPLVACVTRHSEYLDVLCSDRDTAQAETALLGQVAREMALKLLMRQADDRYDFAVVDVAPSITLLQTCAMMFAQNVLIPLDMDMLSLQGAQMVAESTNMLNEVYGSGITVVGFLPTQVNHRHSVTDVVSTALSLLSRRNGIPVLPEIRTDQTVHKAARQRQFIWEYDPKCKAAEDYLRAFPALTEALEARHGKPAQAKA